MSCYYKKKGQFFLYIYIYTVSAADTKPGGNKKINHCHHVKKNSFKKPMPFIDIFVITYSVPIQTKKKKFIFPKPVTA